MNLLRTTAVPLALALLIAGTFVLCVLSMPQSAIAQPGRAHGKHPQSNAVPTRTAPTTNNVPNALQGFSKNRGQPIQIEANSLEVRDKDKVATFHGNVHVTQGDTDLRCNSLVVYYEPGRDGTSGSRSSPPTSDAQRIRQLEAKGNVVVTQKEQTATGDRGIFDMRKNVITLTGNVAITQGKSVLRGDRLVVDMTTGISHMESNRGRVQGLFQPSKRDDGKAGSGILPKLR